MNRLIALAATALLACTTAFALPSIEVNRASDSDLTTVRGIGPSTSRKILAARPFRDWADLIDRVSGIGPATAVKLSAQGLTVNGMRYERAPEPWKRFEPRPLLPTRP